jgi:D-lactate dehydrogenase (cytochrome)
MEHVEARVGPRAVARLEEALRLRLGARCSSSETVRLQHAHTTTWLPAQPADLVVFPETTEEVAFIVGLCAEHGVPVIPFGTGTSLEGHVNAPFGGVTLVLRNMTRIVSVNADDLDVTVEAGVSRKELNTHLRDTGLFFPIDPGADASIGGMASTRASGTNAVRYGTMKDNVLALTVVLPNGDVMRTGSRARKSSAGYDLTRLLIGAEGTLGIITEVTLKLHGIPEAVSGGICAFPSVAAACETVIATIQSGIPVARIELLDEMQIRACNAYSKLSLPEVPTLFVEFHGTEAGVAAQAERFGALAADVGGGPFTWTTQAEERSRLWQARHDAYWASLALRPGAKGFSTDVCVPISRLAECVTETQRDIAASGIIAPIVGHVGDGNFHTLPLVDMDDAQEIARVEAYISRLIDRAQAMGGTCTGEHGVGQAKMKYLEREHGRAALEAMAAIKRALDPRNIMNPGKVVAIRPLSPHSEAATESRMTRGADRLP